MMSKRKVRLDVDPPRPPKGHPFTGILNDVAKNECKGCGPGWDYSDVLADGLCPSCLKSQRDALLEACKEAVSMMDSAGCGGWKHIEVLRAAIAKCESEEE
jgi:hypothetical protein